MFFYFVTALIAGRSMWKTILKPGAYPASIKWYLKWFHAFVVFYLFLEVLGAIDDLFFLFRYRHDLLASFSSDSIVINGPAAGTAYIISCVSGLSLPLVFLRLAERDKTVLPWFFLLSTVNCMAFVYVVISDVNDKHSGAAMVLVVFVSCGIWLSSVVFYLSRSIRKSLFESI